MENQSPDAVLSEAYTVSCTEAEAKIDISTAERVIHATDSMLCSSLNFRFVKKIEIFH